ncbi:RBBP9/YdeN family alpha/beta hydrolase [Sphingomonas profundi]|uniref:RBBP9/YdeN family alpha/beta hydrolase n=1 Tax=Alterirhizorhabdus profundi TaxID=2681549 RepID=UPI001E33675B|nr:alpha/beta hydrolase [Sphingomonas profundi]
MAQAVSDFSGRRPLILTVPGLGGSGPAHWQSLWESSRGDTARVDLGMWDSPHRNVWVTKLDQAIRTAKAPIILAAHSLGCLAVAWWAELAGQPWGWPVAGALLVAPPDVDRAGACAAIRGFAPSPRVSLPFPSILVASDDDPYASVQRSFDMARDWGSHHVEIGAHGHINAESGIGLWHEGQALLDRLIGAAEGPMAHGAALAEVQAMIATEARP